jgi:hypothetical protein
MRRVAKNADAVQGIRARERLDLPRSRCGKVMPGIDDPLFRAGWQRKEEDEDAGEA